MAEQHTRPHRMPAALIDLETCVGCNTTVCKRCQPNRIVTCALAGRHCTECRATCLACTAHQTSKPPQSIGVVSVVSRRWGAR